MGNFHVKALTGRSPRYGVSKGFLAEAVTWNPMLRPSMEIHKILLLLLRFYTTIIKDNAEVARKKSFIARNGDSIRVSGRFHRKKAIGDDPGMVWIP